MCSDYTLGVFCNVKNVGVNNDNIESNVLNDDVNNDNNENNVLNEALITIISKVTFLTKTIKNNVLNARNEKQYVRAIKNELCNFVS